MYRIVSEKFFWKNPELYKECVSSLTFLPPSNFVVFDCYYFLCYWLQRDETWTNCSNQPTLSTFEPNLCIRPRLLWLTSYANEKKGKQWRQQGFSYMWALTYDRNNLNAKNLMKKICFGTTLKSIKLHTLAVAICKFWSHLSNLQENLLNNLLHRFFSKIGGSYQKCSFF